MQGLAQMAIERPELIKILSNVQSDWSAEIAFTYHILNTFAHVFHMRQRKVLSDNEWTGWLRWMKSAFEQGKIKEYWESNLEVEKWFDPAFEEFINKELTPAATESNECKLNDKSYFNCQQSLIAQQQLQSNSLEENKALIKSFIEQVFNKHNSNAR